ncbi:MAG TPA: GMC family oxidoreductase [Flavisolibacter sp.]|nr:GMC family oxidoreductase [Flavisolibacter sp.]
MSTNISTSSLTRQELNLKSYLRLMFFIYLGGVFLYLLPAIGLMPGFLKPYTFINDPAFANNSTIKMGLFAALCFVAAGDVRRYLIAVEAIMVVMAGAVLSGIILILFAKNNYTIEMAGGSSMKMSTLILMSSVFDAILNGILIVLYQKAQKARYGLQYFSPMQFRALEALAEVVITNDKKVISSEEVALNVDRYLSSFAAKTKWVMKMALIAIELYPLVFLKPPTSYMRPDERKAFLERHFYQDVSLRLAPEFIRTLVQAMIRIGKQLCYMGYYNDSRVHESVGYVPFSRRDDSEKRLKDLPLAQIKPLEVLNAKDIQVDVYDWDGVVIIGSGPGASIMAKGLVEKGQRVLMVERGEHVDPSQFSEDEIEMGSKLYADGALQQAADFRFQVIQGSTVGGSSVVNNAVCFDTPLAVLDRWNDRNDIDAGLDLERYLQSNKAVNRMIGVRKIDGTPNTMSREEYLNPGGVKFTEGIAALKLEKATYETDSVAANICNCVGCGYCNIGCKFGKKLSMLNTILPQIQEDLEKQGKHENFQIIAGCEVQKLKSKGKKITSVIGQFKNGRKVEIRGRTFVVAAGAISSSLLLQRSGIASGLAGKNISFNVGSAITAVFPEKINSYKGLQISHYLTLSPTRGFIFETWFNPPMFQSTAMPGWWEDHYRNMQRYNRMACTGILVGSESNAEVRVGGLTKRDIRYKPTQRDFDAVLDGVELAGLIYLKAGAECVMPNTFKYHEYPDENALKRLKHDVKDSSDITLGSGHPQGGNILSRNRKKGVVDEQFKVYGYDNLFISDASVFPTSVGVNPQITVMALADYAVPFVADNAGTGRVTLIKTEMNKV